MQHQSTRVVRLRLLVPVVPVLLAAACATTEAPPRVMTIPHPTVRIHGETEQTRDGITINVTPITPETLARHPQVYPTFTQTQIVQPSAAEAMFGAQARAVTSTYQSNIVPYPAFQVRIANHTGHVIRFTQTVFRLSDNTQRTFPLFASAQELISWNEGDFGAGMGSDMSNRLRQSVGALQLLNRNTELLNGDEWTGYLVFNTIARTSEWPTFASTVERFTLRIAEVPVDVNEAGATTRTTEFTYVFDKSAYQQPVTCPAGTLQPTLETCQWGSGGSSGGAAR